MSSGTYVVDASVVQIQFLWNRSSCGVILIVREHKWILQQPMVRQAGDRRKLRAHLNYDATRLVVINVIRIEACFLQPASIGPFAL